jgi:polyribonucleotide nucleotidyltransferase
VLAAALDQAHDARMQVLEVMNGAISEPRPDVREGAPKIVTFEIPLDKIGEVIGPKGKVINTMQQETGADINVDDEAGVGRVTIGAKDGAAVDEARRRISLILDPPRAAVGEVYQGKVVNITKFGAFVNILPGRDGLIHISKLGKGRRVERVEDVLELGADIEVRVDEIDAQTGKVALSPIGDEVAGSAGDGTPNGDVSASPTRSSRSDETSSSSVSSAGASTATGAQSGREVVSFEEQFEQEARETFGDLGPASEPAGAPRPGGGDGGGPRRNRDRRRRR